MIFRVLVLSLAAGVLLYTVPVVSGHGLNFVQPFLVQLVAGGWQGQFNADFLAFLILSEAWMLWRNRLHPLSWLGAVAVLNGGIVFLGGYLFWLHVRHRGDMRVVLLGNR